MPWCIEPVSAGSSPHASAVPRAAPTVARFSQSSRRMDATPDRAEALAIEAVDILALVLGGKADHGAVGQAGGSHG